MNNSLFQLPIVRWAEWDPLKTDQAQSKLDFVEPMMRRRLSSLAKSSLRVAHECADGLSHVRTIYASRHGELIRTTEMLSDLAQSEMPSPTTFSMSVLNASMGLYSIISGNTAPATAISAGEETFGYALLEAHLQLSSHPDAAVLLVYAEEPVPEIYAHPDQTEASPHALALLLRQDASMHMRCLRTGSLEGPAEMQSRAFVRALESQSSSYWQGKQGGWEWSLAA